MLTNKCKDVWCFSGCKLQQIVKFGESAKCSGDIENTYRCIYHVYDEVRA